MNTTETYIKFLEQKLKKAYRKNGLLNACKGLTVFFAYAVLIILVLTGLEYLGNFSSTVRTAFFWFGIIALGGGFVYLVILPLWKAFKPLVRKDYLNTAAETGKFLHGPDDELFNTLQIYYDKNELFSGQLIDNAVISVYRKIKNIDLGNFYGINLLKKHFRISGISAVFFLLLFLFLPGLFQAAYRIINYERNFTPPAPFTFIIQPGDTTITKNENIFIRIKTKGKTPEFILFKKKSVEETGFSDKIIKPDSTNIFTVKLNDVKSSLEYFAEAENIKSKIFNIKVINRPLLGDLEMEIVPPAYSKLPVEILKDNGNITALPGTKVNVSLNASQPLDSAKIIFDSGKTVNLKTKNNSATGKFVIHKDTGYYFSLTDTNGISNENPIKYSIKTLFDEYPVIKVVLPGKNVTLPEDDKLPLAVKIKDDYGLTKLFLKYRLSSSEFKKTKKEFSKFEIVINKNMTEDDVYYLWNLFPLRLAANDVISYYFEVFDNDNINGPKSAKSKIYTVRVPTLDELFTQAEETQLNAEKELMETLKEAEKIKDELKNLNYELKKKQKRISWEEKNKLEKTLEKFEKLNDKISDIKKKMQNMQSELNKNNLLSKETMEKYMELQKLLDEMNSEEMKKALEKMQEALQKMMRNDVQNSLDKLSLNEEMFKKSVERTLKLLKRIQIEQKVDELVKRTEEIFKKQNELKNETGKNEKDKSDELSKKQNEITKDLERLEKEMQKLKEKMGEFKDMPNEDLEKMMKEFAGQKNQQLSEKAKSDLDKKEMMKALQTQNKISQNMREMSDRMQQMKSNLQRKSQMQTLAEMIKITSDLVSLSKEEEKLKNETSQIQTSSPGLDKKAERQFELQNDVNKILKQMSALSEKTFAITPEMGRALGSAKSDMQKAISALQSRNGTIASIHQKNAMQELNKAATLMNASIQQMMNGGSGGGMISLMQQMQQLSQQQMQLNQMTQMLNNGNLSMEQQAQLQRLAQQQAMIQKSLEELNKEAEQAGESKKLTANLEKILDEMKEVVSNLETQKINDELINKQKHILSKLLDAQRSINERDYEKKRISRAGKDFQLKTPPELIFNENEGKDLLREELIKAVNEGYSKDYEDLIRKYYEALEKENQSK